MKANHKLALSLIAGAVLGAGAISALHAQAKPPTYLVIDIAEITDAEAFKANTQRPGTATQFEGRYVARSQKFTSLDGPVPARFVMVAFESPEKAKAWADSAEQKETIANRKKSSKSRSFMFEGAM
jgi:uncharacterized protein (DUF1330 family)